MDARHHRLQPVGEEEAVKLGEVGDGMRFRTRLTKRSGLVLAHTQDRGVLVKWRDGMLYYVHSEVEVDPVEVAS